MDSFLLDTHVFLWAIEADSRLSTRVRRLLETSRRVIVSDVTLWETATKVSVGKFRARPDVATWFAQNVASARFGTLAIERTHLARVGSLPMLHRDPFDRLLIAQAQIEQLVLVTADEDVRRYDVETIGVES